MLRLIRPNARMPKPLRLGAGLTGVLALGLAACSLAVLAAKPSARVDFNFQVRPLLSDRCFKCHGPDEKARKAKLRLDDGQSAFALRDAKKGTHAVVAGHPETSEVYRRITSTDPDEMMPPPKSGLNLSTEDKELIRRWIAQGGEYKPHWSLIPVGPVEVPKPHSRERIRNAIDAFVLDRLDQEGLALAPEASRETLIRRLSFDLTGLPPSLEEIDQFLTDVSPKAYENVVDRLLSSTTYGERRANEWLDLARYADTYGYQADVERDMSAWRDWVIRAFNQNLPYDQFVTWQIAGDLLPKPTRDQVLATAFNRLHRQTNEGGSIEEEFRNEYAADRVQTAGTVFLGLTLECCRCHDHKFDPIKQRDFYRFMGFFNNIDESGLYSHFTQATPSPTLLLYGDGVEARELELKQRIRTAETKLSAQASGARGRFAEWMANHAGASVEVPAPTAVYSFEEVKDNATPNAAATNQSATLVDGPVQVDGKIGKALRFSGDNMLVCKGAGVFNRANAFSFSLYLKPSMIQERAVVFHRSRAWSDSGSRGYELVLDKNYPTFGLIHFWPGNAVQIKARTPLPTNQWTHLAVTYDGSSRADGLKLYVDGKSAQVEVVRDNLFKDIVHRAEWGDFDAEGVDLALAGRFRDSGFKDGEIDEFKVFDRCLTPVEVQEVAGASGSPIDVEARFAWYLQRVDQSYQTALGDLAKLRQEENKLINDVREIMVMKEMPGRRPTFVLKRGAYDAPGEQVDPGTPEKIFPFPPEWPRNRLGLARWLVDRSNPLTARVEVNRVWRSLFGRGLVATAEDFGSQGQLPTHPALLDWLSRSFIDNGWDLKALQKLIVMSATYRQSSLASPELLAKDPDNRLLARGPKHRLQAEQIRDNALAVSGLLVRQIGGPSVRPYQPAGLWEEAGTGKTYVQDKGEKLYRRSLYTFWRRTAPPPTMLTFDATSREVCTAKRETTSTPLQALVLLNDPQFVEAARALAQRALLRGRSNVDEWIDFEVRLAIGRHPSAKERQVLERLYREQFTIFEQDPAAAEKYLRTGEQPVDPALPATQLAAASVVASTLMNLDEFVMER